jgi:hypothetical protein
MSVLYCIIDEWKRRVAEEDVEIREKMNGFYFLELNIFYCIKNSSALIYYDTCAYEIRIPPDGLLVG